MPWKLCFLPTATLSLRFTRAGVMDPLKPRCASDLLKDSCSSRRAGTRWEKGVLSWTTCCLCRVRLHKALDCPLSVFSAWATWTELFPVLFASVWLSSYMKVPATFFFPLPHWFRPRWACSLLAMRPSLGLERTNVGWELSLWWKRLSFRDRFSALQFITTTITTTMILQTLNSYIVFLIPDFNLH